MAAVEGQNLRFNIEKLRSEVFSIMDRCTFFSETDQISLRHRSGLKDQDHFNLFRDGIGSLYDFEKKQWLGAEKDFCENHPLLANTYLAEIVQGLNQWTKGRVGRFRIMRLKPKRCYSWHIDPDLVRFHIPIQTNEACFYLTKEGGMEQLNDLGRLYAVRTNVFHTALNASNQDRIHLVMSTF